MPGYGNCTSGTVFKAYGITARGLLPCGKSSKASVTASCNVGAGSMCHDRTSDGSRLDTRITLIRSRMRQVKNALCMPIAKEEAANFISTSAGLAVLYMKSVNPLLPAPSIHSAARMRTPLSLTTSAALVMAFWAW